MVRAHGDIGQREHPFPVQGERTLLHLFEFTRSEHAAYQGSHRGPGHGCNLISPFLQLLYRSDMREPPRTAAGQN